jgi:hypothetical protein
VHRIRKNTLRRVLTEKGPRPPAAAGKGEVEVGGEKREFDIKGKREKKDK